MISSEITLSWPHLYVHILTEVFHDYTPSSGLILTRRQMLVVTGYLLSISLGSPHIAVPRHILLCAGQDLHWTHKYQFCHGLFYDAQSILVRSYYFLLSFTPFWGEGVLFLLQCGNCAQIIAKIVTATNLLMPNYRVSYCSHVSFTS